MGKWSLSHGSVNVFQFSSGASVVVNSARMSQLRITLLYLKTAILLIDSKL